MGKVEDPQAEGVAAEYVEKTADWQSWSPGEQAWLAGVLARLGRGGAAARQRLLRHVTGRHLADLASTKAVTPAQWRDLASSLSNELSAEAKGKWIDGIASSFAGTPGRIAALKPEQVPELHDAVIALEARGRAVSLVLSVVEQSPVWENWDSGRLRWLADLASKAGEAGRKSRLRIVEHVSKAYLRDAKTARSMAPFEWKVFSETLRADLSAEQRGKWIEGIRGAYLEGPDGPRLLKNWWNLKDTVTALSNLGDRQAANAIADYVTGTTAWVSWKPDDLGGLAEGLRDLKDAGLAGRQVLIRHVDGKYVTGVKAARSLSTRAWKALCGSLGQDIPPSARARWIAALRRAFLADLAAVKQKGLLDDVTSALAALGDQNARRVLAEFASASRTWRQWSVGDLAWLARELSGLGEPGQPSKRQIAAHVMARCLTTDKATRAGSCGDWRDLARCLSTDLSADDRGRWAARLRGAYVANPATRAKLNSRDLEALTDALRSLKDQKADALPAACVAQESGWQAWPPGDLARLAGLLGRSGDEGKGARQRVLEHISTKCLADPAAVRTVSCRDWRDIAVAVAGWAPTKTCQSWAKSLESAFIRDRATLLALKIAQIKDLTEALRALDSSRAPMALAAWMTRAHR